MILMATKKKRKRQFQHTAQRKEFHDRKVQHTGHTRTLSVGQIIPEDWLYVRMRVIKKKPGRITVRIQKLLGKEDVARIEKVNYKDKQDA